MCPAKKNLSPEGQNFVDRLLDKNLETRMVNSQETGMLSEHDWFKGFDWAELMKFGMPAPFKPKLQGPEDTRFFEEFKSEPLKSSQIPLTLDEEKGIAQENWNDFQVRRRT